MLEFDFHCIRVKVCNHDREVIDIRLTADLLAS